MILRRDEDLARKGYEAYARERENIMGSWDTLVLAERDRWVAAARAIAAAAVQEYCK